MVGKILTGKSFQGVLQYLFEGRKQDSKSEQELAMQNKKAEVLAYNQCFGNKKQLIREFIEASKLNPKVSRPVFHCSISFAFSDAGKLKLQDKIDMAEKLAQEFKFQNNQYVVIAHNDTDHTHLHIVANRIGYDSKTASDSNSYKRMAEYCRKMEMEYKLEKVLSPNRFLAPEQRVKQSQRVDNRKEALKLHLSKAIKQCKSVNQIKQYMEKNGYEVKLERGIAFVDQQQVYFKGSQVGFSLQAIQNKLVHEQALRQQQILEQHRRKEKEQQQELEQKRERKQSRGLSL
jgi:hypothetical protein